MLTADEASYCEVRLGPAAGLAPDGILLTGDWHLAEDLAQITLAKQ